MPGSAVLWWHWANPANAATNYTALPGQPQSSEPPAQSPPALILHEHVCPCTREALPNLSEPFCYISSAESPSYTKITPICSCHSTCRHSHRKEGMLQKGWYQRCFQEAGTQLQWSCCEMLLERCTKMRKDEAGR